MESDNAFHKLLMTGVVMKMNAESKWYIAVDHGFGTGETIYEQKAVIPVVQRLTNAPYYDKLLEGIHDTLFAATLCPVDDAIRLVNSGFTALQLKTAFESGVDIELLASLKNG